MTCASCAGRVERAIRSVPGVAEAAVNLATESRASGVPARRGGLGPVVAAIERAGYAPVLRSVDLAIHGMTCASCAGRVEKALIRVPGVVSAEVNLALERARVAIAGSVSEADLLQAVERAGYRADLINDESQREQPPKHVESRAEALRVATAVALTLPLRRAHVGRSFGLHWMLPGLAPVRAGDAGAVLARRALLPRRMEGAAGRDRQHGPAGGARHHRAA